VVGNPLGHFRPFQLFPVDSPSHKRCTLCAVLHKSKVVRAVWGNTLRQTRKALGLKRRARNWPPNGLEPVVQHHTDLLQRFLDQAPKSWSFSGKTVCEIGCSDCLAIAGFLLGKGAASVDLVEPSPPVLHPLQLEVLAAIRQAGWPLDNTFLRGETGLTLDKDRVTYHNCFMESLDFENRFDYLFSFDVMEHVEDLDGFYTACRRVLKPRGQMFHSIDFSGHSEFEDPVPPLDFQTYPDWLYYLMYPPFHRTTRRFVSHHRQAVAGAGLVVDEIRVVRRADALYMASVRPRLRSRARSLPAEELSVLQAVIVSHKSPEAGSS
jgi:SAM-dependent methyltransferase